MTSTRSTGTATIGRTALLACCGSAAALLPATATQAGGFYLQEQSTRAVGRAFSGEVADQGAASLWWNPAAIAGATGGSAYIGASMIRPKGDVVDTGTLIVRPGQAPASVGGDATTKNPINNGVLPSGGVGFSLTDQLALGVAVTSPFSFTTNYPSDSWARYTADKTKLRTIDIQPTIAFAPSPAFGIGVAINAEHSDATLSNALPNLSPLLADGHQTLEGKGWDFGWSVGAQVKPMGDALTIGIAYKSSIKHTLKGDVTTEGLLGPIAGQNGSIDTKASFRTPWQALIGARIKAGESLTLNGSVGRVGWKKFDAIDLGAPLNVAIPEGYRNTWNVAGGADFTVTPDWTLRAGVQWDQTPTRDGHRDARVPDSNRMNYSVGTSYALGTGFMLDAAFMYTDFKNATIDRTTAAYAGSPVQTPILVSGELRQARALVFSLGGRLTF